MFYEYMYNCIMFTDKILEKTFENFQSCVILLLQLFQALIFSCHQKELICPLGGLI